MRECAVHEDTPEQIAMCLSCTRPKCVNCLDSHYIEPKMKVGPGGGIHQAARNRLKHEEKIRELNALGLNDTLIAKEMGMTPSHVSKMRRRMGLPKNKKRGPYARRERAEAVPAV